MDKQKLITEIVDGLGGIQNISDVSNCMTRMRVVIKDETKVDKEKLKRIEGVIGVVGKSRVPQIVLGPGVAEESRALVEDLLKQINMHPSSDRIEDFNKKKRERNQIFTFISQVFTPMIPALAGTGLLFGLMKLFQYLYIYFDIALFNSAPIADGGSMFMAALSVIAASFFSIMNIAVAAQTTKVMGGNIFVGMAVGAIVSNVGSLNGVAIGFLDLQFKNGMGGTLAALIGGVLVAIIEKRAKKFTPSSLQVHLPSLLAVAVTGLIMLFVIQPITGIMADAMTNVVLWLLTNAGALGGAILSGTFLPLVAMGIHHIFTPIHTTLLQELGYTALVPFSSLAGAGLAGIGVGLLIKYRNKKYKKLRSSVIGNLPTQLLGISEPMIYGIGLPLWRPFIAANLGAAVGGFVLGLFPGQGAEAMNVSGLLGMLVNTKPFAYILSYGVAVIAAAAFTYFMGVKDENMQTFIETEES